MGSPLSAPFSLYPTPSPPPSSEASPSKTLHSCTYPPCRYRTPLPADLDRHLAIHHSSIGHSPISALNTIALLPVTFSEEEDDDEEARPTPMRNYSYPSPPSPPCASAAATTMQHTPERSYHAQPDTVPTWSSSTSSSSSSSRSSSSVGGRGGGGGGGGFFFAKLRGGQSGKKQQQVQQRRRGTVMRCGRHGDEWLGLTGWRFWR